MRQENDLIDFIPPMGPTAIIKIIGVGGGGDNMANRIFQRGIADAMFIVCDTHNWELQQSPVPIKIPLDPEITYGMGSSGYPGLAREAALKSRSSIKKILRTNTKMVFFTASMGSGTGTGAAPVLAKVAKGMGILTIGVITTPFVFEGKEKMALALAGVHVMAKQVDALLIINNEKFRSIYPDLDMPETCAKVDDMAANTVKDIAEIITVQGHTCNDFADVYAVMENSGLTIMWTEYAEGENKHCFIIN